MKIALFTESYHPVVNGVTRSVDIQVAALASRGHETVIYAPGGPNHLKSSASVRRYPHYIFPGAPDYPLAIPLSPTQARHFAAQGYDLVHAQTPFAMGLCGLRLARRHGIPVVGHMHTLYVEYAHYMPTPQSVSRWIIRSANRAYYNRVDAVIVPSPSVKRLIESYGIHRPVHVAPTGIPVTEPMDRDKARAVFNLAPDVPVLLYTGRLAREKNISVLLAAFELIRKQIPESRLLVLGSGPAHAESVELARSLKLSESVIFAGFRPRDDVVAAASAADVFLFPSVTDTQAISVVEAMACGAPPVVSDAYGPADVVEDWVSGRVVAPDEKLLADAALEIIGDSELRARLSLGARRRAKQLSPDGMADELLAVYESVLPVRRVGARR